MYKSIKIILLIIFSCTLLGCYGIESNTPKSYPVTLDNKILFNIMTSQGGMNARTRAEIISYKIKKLAETTSFNPQKLTLLEKDKYTIILAGDESIFIITDKEAAKLNKKRLALSLEYKNIIINAVKNYRQERNFSNIVKRWAYFIISTILLFIILKYFLFINLNLVNKIKEKSKQVNSIKLQKLKILSALQINKIALFTVKILKLFFISAAIYFYLLFVFSLFPWTNSISEKAMQSLLQILLNCYNVIVGYIPNIFILFLIILVTKYISTFVTYFFNGIKNEKINIPGFYKEWAEPTIKILKFLVWAMALAIIFPYLPGADTEAFKGISVFIGALVTFGSGSSISNIMAGIVLTYTRAFNIGDKLKIGETFGDVFEKNLLVTRIKTPKLELISIPNSIVLQSHIINYTQNTSEFDGIILHTSVTIGYDAPWRQVHKLLINAALETKNILKEPKPFVLQMALNDFYVTYEINAYTANPSFMLVTYSELHQNIQDKFNDASLEIMSPHYGSIRDGNSIAIPDEYKKDYQSPGFNINLSNKNKQ